MKKDMLMTFVDYFIVLLLSFFGLLVFSWMLEFSWGYTAYSAIFCLILFGMIYSRAWNRAKKDIKQKIEIISVKNGIKMALPLLLFNLLVILLFALIQSNIIPIRDLVLRITYEFPENQPRVEHQIIFLDMLTPYIRIWFAYLVGFMGEITSVLVLLLSPALIFSGGILGYFAGMKKFYISEVILATKEKVKEKFNE